MSPGSQVRIPIRSAFPSRACIAPPASAGSRRRSARFRASRSVAVNLATEQATVSFLGPADLEAVLAAINKAGYASVLTTAQFLDSRE